MAKKVFIWNLALSILLISIVPHSNAMFVPTGDTSTTAQDLRNIATLLEEKLISQRLLDLGFTPEQIQQRISALTDDQIHTIATQLQQIRVGGLGEGVLIGILII